MLAGRNVTFCEYCECAYLWTLQKFLLETLKEFFVGILIKFLLEIRQKFFQEIIQEFHVVGNL